MVYHSVFDCGRAASRFHDSKGKFKTRMDRARRVGLPDAEACIRASRNRR